MAREGDELRDANQSFERDFEAGVVRSMNSFTVADSMLVPEIIALTITEDQIDELKLPAMLIAFGVVVSTAGSVMSLWT